MKQHRSKHALTLQFHQRDYLPTITEDLPIEIDMTPVSLKLLLPIICQSPNDERHIKGNSNDGRSMVMEAAEITRQSGVVGESLVTTAASRTASGWRTSSFSHFICFLPRIKADLQIQT
jgi:hypothetical protein